jgi:hypothetical protein
VLGGSYLLYYFFAFLFTLSLSFSSSMFWLFGPVRFSSTLYPFFGFYGATYCISLFYWILVGGWIVFGRGGVVVCSEWTYNVYIDTGVKDWMLSGSMIAWSIERITMQATCYYLYLGVLSFHPRNYYEEWSTCGSYLEWYMQVCGDDKAEHYFVYHSYRIQYQHGRTRFVRWIVRLACG